MHIFLWSLGAALTFWTIGYTLLTFFVGSHPNFRAGTVADFFAHAAMLLAIGWGVTGTLWSMRRDFDAERAFKVCVITMAVAAYTMSTGRFRATIAEDQPVICRVNPKAPGCLSQPRLL